MGELAGAMKREITYLGKMEKRHKERRCKKKKKDFGTLGLCGWWRKI